MSLANLLAPFAQLAWARRHRHRDGYGAPSAGDRCRTRRAQDGSDGSRAERCALVLSALSGMPAVVAGPATVHVIALKTHARD
jgi:hypothetical protein